MTILPLNYQLQKIIDQLNRNLLFHQKKKQIAIFAFKITRFKLKFKTV